MSSTACTGPDRVCVAALEENRRAGARSAVRGFAGAQPFVRPTTRRRPVRLPVCVVPHASAGCAAPARMCPRFGRTCPALTDVVGARHRATGSSRRTRSSTRGSPEPGLAEAQGPTRGTMESDAEVRRPTRGSTGPDSREHRARLAGARSPTRGCAEPDSREPRARLADLLPITEPITPQVADRSVGGAWTSRRTS
jgi:hypothetical protein